MATVNSVTLASATNSSAALMRGWASFIHSVFALAWTQTADTGQINLATFTVPVATDTSAGYEIWKMADALQATQPVFVKIEYATGAAVNTPAIFMTIATGSDGAGNLTGTTLFARSEISSGANSAVAQHNYGSADTNRVSFGVALDNAPIFISIERTKDSTGADTNLGIIFLHSGATGTTTCRSLYLPFTTTIPSAQFGYHIVLTTTTPSALSGNVGVSPVIPMGYDAKQPGMNQLVCLVNDFAAYASVAASMYGVSHTYQHLGAAFTTHRASTASSIDANTRVMMRYE